MPATDMSDKDLDDLVLDCAASFYGTWKNRGLLSHHCVVLATSVNTEEILDIEYISNLCS